MNGADYRTHAEAHAVDQLPTPASSPEPEYVASTSDHRNTEGPLPDITNGQKTDEAHNPDITSPDKTSGALDEAIMSDTNEKIRPIKRPGDARRRSSTSEHDKTLKLSPLQLQELTGEPASIPVRTATPIPEDALEGAMPGEETDTTDGNRVLGVVVERPVNGQATPSGKKSEEGIRRRRSSQRRGESQSREWKTEREIVVLKTPGNESRFTRPHMSSRSVTTPAIRRMDSSSTPRAHPPHPHSQDREERRQERHNPPPRYVENPAALPMPPMSMPTFLSLELAATRPSPLYIHRPSNDDFPYESSVIKYERLLNFLKIPLQLEGVLAFGTLACLDAWMHVMTILPLRFLLAIAILVKWWGSVIVKEFRDLSAFIYSGLPRVWKRRKHTDTSTPAATPAEEEPPSLSRRASGSNSQSAARASGDMSTSFKFPEHKEKEAWTRRGRNMRFRHRRTKSTPSLLLPNHKADILKGLLVVASCFVLMRFDASRMYHGIRGQSAIKLYVIYNLLEVCDRLLSALGQDILECLFSRETLDRNPDGRSKVIRPFWMFMLALVYTVVHATALFYQVITLNVAVNSYSNALLTLLMSNQFVEIKGTVFKKFEKESLFQITCADVVERFQLWLMLLIIAMRNVVEVGGLSIHNNSSWTALFTGGGNATSTASFAGASSIIPMSFTIFPKYIAQVLNPFLLVLGSEMGVDWLKHAYITKFNQTKPAVYSKYFDVLAKDYYTNAFTDPNLTRRLGLPVIPLSCLFIRAAIQTYHMFVATHMPPPLASFSTSLVSEPTSSPATTAALAHIDHVFRRALGRSSFGAGAPTQRWYQLSSWTLDDAIAGSAMLTVFLVTWMLFLAFKLLLGMALLSVARKRCLGMRERELLNVETGGKRIGGWGVVDVDEEKRRYIHVDDAEGLKALRDRDEKQRVRDEAEAERGSSFGHVSRYAMVAKRIW